MSVQRPHTAIEKNTVEALTLPRSSRVDTYNICRFTEDDNYEMAQLAWRIHAEGYESMRFVKSTAVTEDGYLQDGIDKSRGSLVDYYVAINGDVQADIFDAATLRKINLSNDGALEDLPAYQLCKDSLYEEGGVYLRSIINPEARLKEIGAMARTETSSPLAIFELLRNGVHECLGNKEIWFSSIVSTTYDTLTDNFGHSAIRQIGHPVTIQDARVSESITLIPAVVDIDMFFNEIHAAFMQDTDPKMQFKKMRSLLFFTDGITDQELGSELATVRKMAYQHLETSSSNE